MNCRHCHQWNPEDEERCHVCNGKLRPGANDTSEWELSAVNGSLATAPVRARAPRLQAGVPLPAEPSPQRQLFADRQPSNVVEIRSGSVRPPIQTVAPATKPSARKAAVSPKAPAAIRKPVVQTELDFLPAAPPAPRTLKTKVEASIFCDAVVATLTHRFFGGFIDFTLILLQYAVCLASYYGMGGEFPVNRVGYLIFALGFVLIAMLYGLVWAMGNVETPGMRCARLKLTNFDGFPPEPGQRLWRYFGTCLSFATCGFGLLWALTDEEALTWQDHISKTFPTFHKIETNFYKAR